MGKRNLGGFYLEFVRMWGLIKIYLSHKCIYTILCKPFSYYLSSFPEMVPNIFPI